MSVAEVEERYQSDSTVGGHRVSKSILYFSVTYLYSRGYIARCETCGPVFIQPTTCNYASVHFIVYTFDVISHSPKNGHKN